MSDIREEFKAAPEIDKTIALRSPLGCSITQTKSNKSRAEEHSSLHDRVAPGQLSGVSSQAFVDPCAENLVTDRFLRRRGLVFAADARCHMKIADGTSVPTLESIYLSWRFRGENRQDTLRFHVVSTRYSRYAATLGGAYLWMSKILTEEMGRVEITSRKACMRQKFSQGGGPLRMHGVCEDCSINLYPDLASDIPVMSVEFAHQMGKLIDTSSACRVPIRLPGGRIVRTKGRVTDVTFRLGEIVYHEAFYLIHGMPGNILLDAEFLLRTDAFRRHRDLISLLHPDNGDGARIFLALTEVCERKGPLTLSQEYSKAVGNLRDDYSKRLVTFEQALATLTRRLEPGEALQAQAELILGEMQQLKEQNQVDLETAAKRRDAQLMNPAAASPASPSFMKRLFRGGPRKDAVNDIELQAAPLVMTRN